MNHHAMGKNGIQGSGKIRVVVLGTGFAGSTFMEAFKRKISKKNRGKVELTAINQTSYLTFSPLLYEVATGQVDEHHISIPVSRRATRHGFSFIEEEVMKVVPEKNEVVTSHGPITYDYLVMALGAENNDFGIEGVAEDAIPLKSLRDGELIRNRVLRSFRKAVKGNKTAGSQDGELNYVVVGGGASGVELAASLKEYLDVLMGGHKAEGLKPRVILLEAQEHLMQSSGIRFYGRLESLLEESGVELHLNTKVSGVTEEEIILRNSHPIRTENVFWTAGTKSNEISSSLGGSLVEKRSGRVIADSCLRVPAYGNIYVIGDNAFITTGEHEMAIPQTAAAAVQEGKYAGKRVAAIINGKTKSPAFAYKDPGIMLSLGRFRGLCQFNNGIILSGLSAWVAWRLIHLLKIGAIKNRFEVLSDWVFSLYRRRDVMGS